MGMYEVGDYLLVDANGQVQAVSGNTDFWDMPHEGLSVQEFADQYVIVLVVEVSNEDGG